MPFFLRRRRSRRLRRRDLAPDRYLTDGHRLLRVVSRLVNDASVLVVVEDCTTLHVHALAGVELAALGMRPVRSAKPPPGEPPRSRAPGEPGRPVETDAPAVA
jgi:hypothetical protein